MAKRNLWLIGGLLLVGLLTISWARRQRRDPSPFPASQRFFLNLPRPFLSRNRLRHLLAPQAGEQMLEIGPGAGYYSLDVAPALLPGGRLDLLDLQQAMLDETMRVARERGLSNITPHQGDAQALPFADATYDAVFLVATLGEVPDSAAALREMRRVLKPGGRLLVGEGQPDPHMIRLPDLQRMASAAGFELDRHEGIGFGYVARFRAG